MHIGEDLVGAGPRASAVGAPEEVTVGGTWAAVTGDTWAGTDVVRAAPATQVWVADPEAAVDLLWAVEADPEAAVVDLLWAVEDDPGAAVVDLLWAVEPVVAGRV